MASPVLLITVRHSRSEEWPRRVPAQPDAVLPIRNTLLRIATTRVAVAIVSTMCGATLLDRSRSVFRVPVTVAPLGRQALQCGPEICLVSASAETGSYMRRGPPAAT